MRIQVQSRGIEIDARLRRYVERRARFTLSRFDDRIQAVLVRLADMNGPRGGLDQKCQIELTMRNGERMIVESTDFLIEVAVGKTMRIAARRVRQAESRRRTLRLRAAVRGKEGRWNALDDGGDPDPRLDRSESPEEDGALAVR